MEGSLSSMLQLSDRQLEDLLFPYFTAVPGSLMIRGLACSCRRLHDLCWLHVEHLRLQGGSADAYKAGISYAAAGPRLSSAILQCRRSSPVDESPAFVALRLIALPALRNLHVISNAITDLDVLALAQLTSLTSLHLEDAQHSEPCSARGSSAASVAEVQPLARLTGLQQLSITAWQPLGTQGGAWNPPAAEPAAAAGSLCLPAAGMLTNFSMAAIPSHGVVSWLPSMLACTVLQHLQLRITGAKGESYQDINYILEACAEHLTGLTALQLLVAGAGGAPPLLWVQVVTCSAGQSISRLQRLQRLQIEADGIDAYVSYKMVYADAIFRCAALRSLGLVYDGVGEGALDRDLVPAGAVLPHLTELRICVWSADAPWPADAFPNLQSLHLALKMDDMPCHAANIPGSSSITELTLDLYEWYDEECPQPEAARFQGMALALPRLRKLRVKGPGCSQYGPEQSVVQWMQGLSAFTQLQELCMKVAACACEDCSDSLEWPSLLPADGVLRALCKLHQLQQITLSGSAWVVSALFVVGLEVGLTQLSSIRLEGCCGLRAAQQAQQAAIREEMAHVAAGLRAGLQLKHVE